MMVPVLLSLCQIGIYVFLTSTLHRIHDASRYTLAVMVKLFEHIDEFHMYIMGYFSFRDLCALLADVLFQLPGTAF